MAGLRARLPVVSRLFGGSSLDGGNEMPRTGRRHLPSKKVRDWLLRAKAAARPHPSGVGQRLVGTGGDDGPVGGRRFAASRSVTHPTRLETRTKESNMCASQWVLNKPRGAMKAKSGPTPDESGSRALGCGRTDDPSYAACRLGGVRAYTLGPERW